MEKINFKRNSIINKYQNLINDINKLEDELKLYTDGELRIQNLNLQKQYNATDNLNDLLVQSFALTREASRRTLGLRHFDVQLLGGIILNNNKIAEMKTGEGKTLVATLPTVLNTINKKGVHVVTVNDYLANRDQVSMGQIYRYLGLSTGLIQEGMSNGERKINYKSDITYVTNYELTFDFLRDNITTNFSTVVLRPFNYCIIDEVDSVLIDEAQTPIILSDSSSNTFIEKFISASEIVNYLEVGKDYEIDEKNKNVILTQEGSKQVETILGIEDLYDPTDPWIPYIINALKANSLFFNNIHYIIQNKRIIIVDEFTGRIMPDRRWGEGLHQAIEAKENLPISPKTETQASTTYQNFFLMYPKLSGMTGTGKTAEIEFEKIYNLSVEVIPTFRPNQRKDLPDLIYKDQFSKWNAIAKFCKETALLGQPLLIGTTTVEKSEMLAQLLNEYYLSYQILNAKPENVRRESEIVGQAGKKNSITIATNMAGRGTDIILGGNINFTIQKELYNILTLTKTIQIANPKKILKFNLIRQFQGNSQKFVIVLITLLKNKNFLKLSDSQVLKILQDNNRIVIPTISYQCSIRFLISQLMDSNKKHQLQENKIVKNLGGLYVIGTERNDSRRIDNQLRGRCGRQGDPGTSRFFLSLDDNLLRLFGGTKIQEFMKQQILDDLPLESSFITKSLDSAQERVEERAYEQRKNLFDYDDILNKQRNAVYLERRVILENKSLRKNTFSYSEQVICEYIKQLEKKTLSLSEFLNIFETLFGRQLEVESLFYSINTPIEPYIEAMMKNITNLSSCTELKIYMFDEFWVTYQLKQEELQIYGIEALDKEYRRFNLKQIDKIWQEHLQRITLLREAVGWRGYGQKNPLTEYKREAYILFIARVESLHILTLFDFFRTTIV